MREPDADGFHIGFVQVMAAYSDAAGSGTYQGLVPTFAWSNAWLEAELALPLYRLSRSGAESALGLGDLAGDVRIAVVRSDSGSIAAGPELAFTLPSGDAGRELGMGHVMLMPGLWLRLAADPWSVLVQLAYGRALASGSHADHHHDHGDHHSHVPVASVLPRVNPMNAEELEHAVAVRYAVHPNVALTARWLGAAPLETVGTGRQVVAPGLLVQADTLDASLEAQLPFSGQPFDIRVVVAFGARL